MPEFAYTARRLDGKDVSGKISADTERDAKVLLGEQSLFPLRVQPVAAPTPTLWRRTTVSGETLADTLTQLADLLGNGVPLLEALTVLADQGADPVMCEVMQAVRDEVAEGGALDECMAKRPRIFDELTVSMVRAGLEGAFLEEALERVSAFLRRQDELRAKLVGAMTYPAVLAVAGLGVTIFLVVFIVPSFQGFFDRLERSGAGLPGITVALLAVSHVLVTYGWMIAAALTVAFFAARRWASTDQGRLRWDAWKLKLPVFGAVFHSAAVSRLCRVLGTLLRNGVPILKALQISSRSTGNRVLESVVRDSAENVSTGESLSQPLAASGLAPAHVMAMIRVAEESNTLDQVLVKVADRMDRKMEQRLETLVRLVEPIMLLAIGSIVMFIIVGVLLPVFDLNATFD